MRLLNAPFVLLLAACSASTPSTLTCKEHELIQQEMRDRFPASFSSVFLSLCEGRDKPLLIAAVKHARNSMHFFETDLPLSEAQNAAYTQALGHALIMQRCGGPLEITGIDACRVPQWISDQAAWPESAVIAAAVYDALDGQLTDAERKQIATELVAPFPEGNAFVAGQLLPALPTHVPRTAGGASENYHSLDRFSTEPPLFVAPLTLLNLTERVRLEVTSAQSTPGATLPGPLFGGPEPINLISGADATMSELELVQNKGLYRQALLLVQLASPDEHATKLVPVDEHSRLAIRALPLYTARDVRESSIHLALTPTDLWIQHPGDPLTQLLPLDQRPYRQALQRTLCDTPSTAKAPNGVLNVVVHYAPQSRVLDALDLASALEEHFASPIYAQPIERPFCPPHENTQSKPIYTKFAPDLQLHPNSPPTFPQTP